jgi:hypothetical protein
VAVKWRWGGGFSVLRFGIDEVAYSAFRKFNRR